jgi:ribosomal protein S14
MFTKEVRAVFRITNLAKSSFKNSLSWGKVSGFKKSSW